MRLTKYLADAGYDLIEGPVRNHKPLQLWLKQAFNEAELYYSDINHAFKSTIPLSITEDLALKVDSSKMDEFGFNIGITLLDEILKSIGLGAIELSSMINSGKKLSISYDNSVTRIVALGELTNYLSNADFKHPNRVLLKNANRNNILVITGVVFAKNLIVNIETDFDINSNLITSLNEIAEGNFDFIKHDTQVLKMTSKVANCFPIAVKANRIDFDKGVFKGMNLVSDNRNFF